MATEPVSLHPLEDAEPPRLLGLVRLVIALVCLGGPLLVVLGLAGVWYQSVQILEVVAAGHAEAIWTTANQPATAAAWQVKAESLNGVLGVTWSRDAWSDPKVKPLAIGQIEKDRNQFGYYWGRVPAARVVALDALNHPRGRNTEELPPILNFFFGGIRSMAEAQLYQPFGRDRSDIGWTRTFHWKHAHETKRSNAGFGLGGTSETKVEALVAPCWVWMLPWVIPPLWWLWCPPGRGTPRLTIGRSLIATALAAVMLAAVTTVGRSSAADRAMLVVEELGGTWTYRSDPGGSDKMVVTGVTFTLPKLGGAGADAAADRLHGALTQFPYLRHLTINRTKATSAQLARMITGLPKLETLDLNGCWELDDDTLGALRGSYSLRELFLNDTKVTDAGLPTVREMPSLAILWLEDLNLTEPGLATLAGMPNLRRVDFKGNKTALSAEALQTLARSLPKFEVLWNPSSYSVRIMPPAEPVAATAAAAPP